MDRLGACQGIHFAAQHILLRRSHVRGTWPGHPPEAGRARKSCAAMAAQGSQNLQRAAS